MGLSPSSGIKYGVYRGELLEATVDGSELQFVDKSKYETRTVKVPVASHVERTASGTKEHTTYKFAEQRVCTSKRLFLFLKVPGLEEFIDSQAKLGTPVTRVRPKYAPYRIILGDGFPVIPNVHPDKKYRVKVIPLIDEIPSRDVVTDKWGVKYSCRVLLKEFEQVGESLPVPSAPLKNDEVALPEPAIAGVKIDDTVGVLV